MWENVLMLCAVVYPLGHSGQAMGLLLALCMMARQDRCLLNGVTPSRAGAATDYARLLSYVDSPEIARRLLLWGTSTLRRRFAARIAELMTNC